MRDDSNMEDVCSKGKLHIQIYPNVGSITPRRV
jgi:hypothetical protein